MSSAGTARLRAASSVPYRNITFAPLHHVVDDLARHVCDVNVQPRDLTRREALADQGAQRGVTRWVHREHHQGQLIGVLWERGTS